MDSNGWAVSAYLAGAIVSSLITYFYGTRVLGWGLARNKSQEGTIYWIMLLWPVAFPVGVLIEGYSLVKHKRDSMREKGQGQ